MRIGLKLTAAFLGIASLVGAVGYLAQATNREVEHQMERLTDSAIVKADTTEMVDALYASQLAAHALVAAERRDHAATAEPPDHRDRIERYQRRIEQSLARQRLAEESLIRWEADRGALELAERETTRTSPAPKRLDQLFVVHRQLMNEFLILVEKDPDRAERFLADRLCPHFENELLPLLSAHRERAANEFTRGIRATQRAMAMADQRRGLLTALAAAGAILLGLFMSRSIGKPLGELKRAALEVGRGQLDTRITTIHSRDEIGVLATALNQMAADLREKTVSKERLLASLREKELLLKEVHHRVKNNLQVISSLLNLQAQELSDPKTVRLFQESQGRVRSMALIHEQLYRSDDLAHIDFAAYVEQLVAHLRGSFGNSGGRVDVRLDVQPLPLSLDLAIPCGMIVNELVSNALEHAFPDCRPGEIGVEFIRDEAGYRLTVADNG
ncbi:MAG: histidine kinase dimerization/phosphoacceptor domain -containing protein, partial [Planctomycetota bacterium]